MIEDIHRQPESAAGTNEVRMRWELNVLALAAVVGACSERTVGAVAPPERDRETAMTGNTTAAGEPVANLPSSFGRSFATLDEYLEHLRRYAGPVDQPWYREIRPGVYELVTTNVPRGEPRTFTREQLMREYGFTR